MRFLVIFVLAFVVCSTGVSAREYNPAGGNVGALQDRIDQLEKDLSSIQGKLGSGVSARKMSKQDLQNAPKLEVQMAELEDKMSKLNGKLEEVQFNITSVTKKMDKIIADIDYRISAIESQKNAYNAPAVGAPVQAQADATAPVDTMNADAAAVVPELVAKVEKTTNSVTAVDAVESDAGGQYDKAFEYLRKSDYVKAEAALKDFIANNKESPLVSNAYYWLGETFYVREKYDQSAVQFLKGYQGQPKGRKAPDNLLKLGMALDKLDKKQEACTTYDKLLSEFPKAEKAIQDKVAGEQKRLSCA